MKVVTEQAVTREARAALARKYQALVDLRQRRNAGGDAAGGGVLRALAAEFPGCLRELDTLGLPELQRRAGACAQAVASDKPPEDSDRWMAWIDAYHALMRGALRVRDERIRRSGIDPPELVVAATAAAGTPLDEDFVEAVLSPPGGRIGVVVLRALAVRFGTPAATIAAALFPVRRRSPYDL
jgi:hypothetical protein